MISNFFFVALGGSLGAMLRYGISLAALHFWGESFPWGTFLANVIGCLAMGVLVGMGVQRDIETSWLLIGVGVLGALTTFSTFSAESLQMVSDGLWVQSLVNVLGNVVASLGACFIGISIAKAISGS